eukprot:1161565-Pelagomonas_calceolata.AAC.12
MGAIRDKKPINQQSKGHVLLWQKKGLKSTADPLGLSQLVVDLRSRHLANWRQFSGYNPRDTNSKRITYHHWCALPTKPAHCGSISPSCPYLKVEQVTWDDAISPVCDLCDAQDDVQDEQHVLFKCTHPHRGASDWHTVQDEEHIILACPSQDLTNLRAQFQH